jgi:Plant protein of unknown function
VCLLFCANACLKPQRRHPVSNFLHPQSQYCAPTFVSIGPNYYGDTRYDAMQQKKQLCWKDLDQKVRDYRNMFPNKNCPIDSHLLDIIKMEFESLKERARACYPDEIKLGSDEFIEMLVLDSCFVIRVTMLVSQDIKEGMDLLGINLKEIRSDLLLLENQIPLFLLLEAYECIKRHSTHRPPFLKILEPFICLDMPWRFNENGMSPEADHLLDLYWRCCLPPDSRLQFQLRDRFISEDTSIEECWAEYHLPADRNKIIPNSTVLHKIAGVQFIKRNYDKGFNISFKNGILKMPFMRIDPTQEKLLLNLICFENYMHVRYRVITSYVIFLDALIDTDKDIELLQEHEVISNTLFDNASAAGVFNKMGNYCSLKEIDNYFHPLCKKVQKYYKSRWNRRCATLCNNYFSSPWAGISVVAGSALLLMSFLQTFYTVYAYHHPPK